MVACVCMSEQAQEQLVTLDFSCLRLMSCCHFCLQGWQQHNNVHI